MSIDSRERGYQREDVNRLLKSAESETATLINR